VSAYERINDKLMQADGHIFFRCPGCQSTHGLRVTTHADNWTYNGNPDSPTFQPSLLVTGTWSEPPVTAENLADWKRAPWQQTKVERRCHSFITDGRIQFLDDCTHALAGQTVDIPDWSAT
jgi:Family of unknown function (DUF6527)